MANMPDPTYLQRDDDGADCQPPTKDDLLRRWVDGVYTFEQWIDALNAFYPMSEAEVSARIAAQRDAQREAVEA